MGPYGITTVPKPFFGFEPALTNSVKKKGTYGAQSHQVNTTRLIMRVWKKYRSLNIDMNTKHEYNDRRLYITTIQFTATSEVK